MIKLKLLFNRLYDVKLHVKKYNHNSKSEISNLSFKDNNRDTQRLWEGESCIQYQHIYRQFTGKRVYIYILKTMIS